MNSLTFNYRGGGNIGAPKPLDEDSIDYSDFLDMLDKEQVTFVEFMAPYGDKAYATVKVVAGGETAATTKRIR